MSETYRLVERTQILQTPLPELCEDLFSPSQGYVTFVDGSVTHFEEIEEEMVHTLEALEVVGGRTIMGITLTDY